MRSFLRLSWPLLFFLVPCLAFPATVGPGGWIGSWSPGIGDPTVVGWLTVAAYLAASAFCFALFARLRRSGLPGARSRNERILWCALGVLLLLLGINKQLDLQSAFTEVMRMLAADEGWYRNRRYYQVGFIGFLGLWMAAGLGALFYLTHRLSPWTKVAVVGACLILGFVLVRASSFHNVDVLIRSEILHLKVNWILELGGIAVVAAGTFLRGRQMGRAAATAPKGS